MIICIDLPDSVSDRITQMREDGVNISAIVEETLSKKMPVDRATPRIIASLKGLKIDASAAQIAKLTGMTTRTVANKLLQLEAKGEVIRISERSSMYACLWRIRR